MSPTDIDSKELDQTQEVGDSGLKSPLPVEGNTKDAVSTLMQLPEKLAGPGDSIKLEKPVIVAFHDEPYDVDASNGFTRGTFEVSELSPELETNMSITDAYNYCYRINKTVPKGEKLWRVGTMGMMRPFVGKTSSRNHLLTCSVYDNINDGWAVVALSTGEEKVCYDPFTVFKVRLVR